LTKHRSRGGLATAPIPARVHYKERNIPITEIEVMVSWNVGVIIAIRIVNAKRVITLADVIVDNLKIRVNNVQGILTDG
jgi:hypothetical protein